MLTEFIGWVKNRLFVANKEFDKSLSEITRNLFPVVDLYFS